MNMYMNWPAGNTLLLSNSSTKVQDIKTLFSLENLSKSIKSWQSVSNVRSTVTCYSKTRASKTQSMLSVHDVYVMLY